MQVHTFREFDAFASTVRGIDSTMLLQNPTRRSWVISDVCLPDINVQLGRLGSGNIVEGQSWSNRYMIYLPLTDTCAYSVNGTVLDKGAFMVMEPGCEFFVSTRFEHDWCMILVPTHLMAAADGLEDPSPAPEKMICRTTRPNRQMANRFQGLVHRVMAAAACCPHFESTPAAAGAAAELLKVASSVLVGNRHVVEADPIGRPKASRQQIISRSKALLEERHGAPIRVEELAAAAKVSDRTLRTAFHEYFGVGPVGYLQLRQLHQVHRALRAADSEAVHVSDVLVRHGIWDFGRFASRYRRLFGERPSETLRGKRR